MISPSAEPRQLQMATWETFCLSTVNFQGQWSRQIGKILSSSILYQWSFLTFTGAIQFKLLSITISQFPRKELRCIGTVFCRKALRTYPDLRSICPLLLIAPMIGGWMVCQQSHNAQSLTDKASHILSMLIFTEVLGTTLTILHNTLVEFSVLW